MADDEFFFRDDEGDLNAFLSNTDNVIIISTQDRRFRAAAIGLSADKAEEFANWLLDQVKRIRDEEDLGVRSPYSCYEGPLVVNDRVREAAALIENIFDNYSPVGGNLHVQIDDMNLEDQFFEGFENWCRDVQPGQLEAEQKCFEALKSLTLQERCSAIAITDHLIDPATGKRVK